MYRSTAHHQRHLQGVPRGWWLSLRLPLIVRPSFDWLLFRRDFDVTLSLERQKFPSATP
jgi:hypothetical protein